MAGSLGRAPLQLPPVVATGHGFQWPRRRVRAAVSAQLQSERRRLLLELLAELRPQVIVTEMFPFGRRAFRAELLPLLEAARALRPRPLVVASVRDMLVSKRDPRRYGWMVATCLEHYDRVLVHGDDRLLPFGMSFPPAVELGERVVHTGFVHPGATHPTPPAETPPAVLVSAGGGAVGERLLRAAIAARPQTVFASAPWLLVGGQNLPDEAYAGLLAELPHGCTLTRYRADLATLMGLCEVSVSQAGYNTVVEGLAGQARMVLVPFAAGGEDEQEQRARRLAGAGLGGARGRARAHRRDLAAAIDRIAGARAPAVRGLGVRRRRSVRGHRGGAGRRAAR